METRTLLDADGNPTQTMRVEVESPWDDDSREQAIALWEDQQGRCNHCGQPVEVCADPDREWHVGREVCHRTKALDWARRQREAVLDKAVADAETGLMAGDGESLFVSEFEQGDEWFLRTAWPPDNPEED